MTLSEYSEIFQNLKCGSQFKTCMAVIQVISEFFFYNTNTVADGIAVAEKCRRNFLYTSAADQVLIM